MVYTFSSRIKSYNFIRNNNLHHQITHHPQNFSAEHNSTYRHHLPYFYRGDVTFGQRSPVTPALGFSGACRSRHFLRCFANRLTEFWQHTGRNLTELNCLFF